MEERRRSRSKTRRAKWQKQYQGGRGRRKETWKKRNANMEREA